MHDSKRTYRETVQYITKSPYVPTHVKVALEALDKMETQEAIEDAELLVRCLRMKQQETEGLDIVCLPYP